MQKNMDIKCSQCKTILVDSDDTNEDMFDYFNGEIENKVFFYYDADDNEIECESLYVDGENEVVCPNCGNTILIEDDYDEDCYNDGYDVEDALFF